MKKKAIVLFSSGLDSTVNLYEASHELDVLKVLTFDYGQRAADKEIEYSQKVCQKLNLSHDVLSLKWLGQITQTSLVNTSMNVPVNEEVCIDDVETSEETKNAVWVPNRNGVFLNIAASYADALQADFVIPGFNKEEAATFPDNSEDYMHALDTSFSFSTSQGVKVLCYTSHLDKTEIVKKGKSLNVDFSLVWPCYFSGEEPCGECESCQRFERAKEGQI